MSGDYLRGQDNRVTWSADVMLQPWGAGFLQLSDPAKNG